MFKILMPICCLCLLLGCSEPPERIEIKLTPYLQEDLKFMVAEKLRASKDRASLLDSPYYKIRDLRFFDGAKAEIYSAYAQVDFYVFKNIKMYETRKYRYDANRRYWDRYLKQLHFGVDTDEK